MAAVAEFLALPIAAVPVLLLGGALAAWGHLSWPALVAVVAAGALTGDLVWYWVGRWRGSEVLGLACRFSINRDACVAKTKSAFSKVGPFAIVLAKFVPGLGALAAPTAGTAGIPFRLFLVLALAGGAIWGAVWTGVGYLLAGSVAGVQSGLAALNRLTLLAVALAVPGIAGYRLARRRIEKSATPVTRLSPDELHDHLQRGGEATIVDVRSPVDYEKSDMRIPGAIRIAPDALEDHLPRLRRDVLLALYCT